MDDKGDIGGANADGPTGSFKTGIPTSLGTPETGIVDQQAAAEPILSNRREQGIAQTGEEDPLSVIEDPEVAAAVRELTDNQKSGTWEADTAACREEEHDTRANPTQKAATASFDSGFAPVGTTDGEPVLALGQTGSPPPTEIATLRSLAAAVDDSVKAYDYAAREGDEFFRPIFLDRSKARREMVNEFNARILALGGVSESESDHTPGFETSVRQANASDIHAMDIVEEFEANLRSLFLTAIDEQSGETEAFLSTQYLVIQRSEEELRRVRTEFNITTN